MLETKLAVARRPTQPSALEPLAKVVASHAARRFARGLARADLLDDLRAGPHTAIVPIDRAFDALPWSFEALMNDGGLVEARVDLFEYLIVRGIVPECEATAPYRSLHGAEIWIGPDAVFGGYGAARILHTSRTPMQVVHLVDRVVFASPPRTGLVGASPEMDATP